MIVGTDHFTQGQAVPGVPSENGLKCEPLGIDESILSSASSAYRLVALLEARHVVLSRKSDLIR